MFDNWLNISFSPSQKASTLKLKWMKNSWGRCNGNGQITLNIELIKAPKSCIDYVMAHELCHLTYLNHSRNFYNLLENNYPDWRIAKNRLENFMS